MISGLVVRSKVSFGTVSNIDRSYKRQGINNAHVSAFTFAWAGTMWVKI